MVVLGITPPLKRRSLHAVVRPLSETKASTSVPQPGCLLRVRRSRSWNRRELNEPLAALRIRAPT